ncbi:MAG TPA: hypothetical protein VM144_09875 [Aestuariivirga sp.]|nr:hypothetical protein [Aestuariivirga sp.]
MDRHTENQAALQSKLLPLAREIDESMDQCRALQGQGGLQKENAISDRLIALRDELATSTPENPVDALVMVASMQAVTAALARSDLEELGDEAIQLCVREMSHALVGLKRYLERESGVTAEALGLNPDGTRWQ